MQKIVFSSFSLFSLSLFSSLFSFCSAEENGAYASVGVEYSISHAVEHNNPFLNQERIKTISNAQNQINELNQVKSQVKGMPNNFNYINNALKNHSKLTPTEMQAEAYYLQSTLEGIEKIMMVSGGIPSHPKLAQALEKCKNPPLTL
ncbi:hypothetical protein HPSA50_0818 [Helicobacter pylori SouthAfrica50]|uniref:Outer membrane family protein n=1 Tax=Helicobacter pylori SouthAfrica50 TaxID=1352357 RepID=T2S716_HELPX|nr:hypothetical protein HPSA50_0818 [Helicobacter pylori SouthAfrica50]